MALLFQNYLESLPSFIYKMQLKYCISHKNFVIKKNQELIVYLIQKVLFLHV